MSKRTIQIIVWTSYILTVLMGLYLIWFHKTDIK